MQYGMAIRGLVRSGLVDLEKSKLVGVSLCGGAGAQYENSNTSLYALSQMHHSLTVDLEAVPYSALILVELPLFHKPDVSLNQSWNARSASFTNAQPDVWPTIEDAMLWHKARKPWKRWHPEALQVFSVSSVYFGCPG